MDIRITVTGTQAVIDRLNRINDARWAVAPAEASLRLLQSKLSKYPPAIVGSTYKRTGDLGRFWTAEPGETSRERVSRKLGNRKIYSPWVQSKLFQAGVHRGRWLTEVQAVEENKDQIVAIFRAAIERVAR